MDCHNAVFAFHQDIVQVPDRERARLALARDRNVARVRDGLALLGLASPLRDRSQGGYAMHTLTRRDDGDQDIDVALIFDGQGKQCAPSAARQDVLNAVLAVSPRFARAPERRTNAVTVWYSDGYHVDFAVYREGRDGTEHAGSSWRPADPSRVVNWFTDFNKRESPPWRRGDPVHDGQFRRIVRILKFLRQNDDADYPGGYLITALAAQTYVASADGDDVALVNTLRRAAAQLAAGSVIRDPVNPGAAMALRQVDAARLRGYRALLLETLGPLDGIDRRRRTSDAALQAWQNALKFEI
jgi:hypothetical protein